MSTSPSSILTAPRASPAAVWALRFSVSCTRISSSFCWSPAGFLDLRGLDADLLLLGVQALDLAGRLLDGRLGVGLPLAVQVDLARSLSRSTRIAWAARTTPSSASRADRFFSSTAARATFFSVMRLASSCWAARASAIRCSIC